MRAQDHPAGARLAVRDQVDGYRLLATTGSEPRLKSRNGADATTWFPELTDALSHLPSGYILDGEETLHLLVAQKLAVGRPLCVGATVVFGVIFGTCWNNIRQPINVNRRVVLVVCRPSTCPRIHSHPIPVEPPP